jgi:hypothetical protein
MLDEVRDLTQEQGHVLNLVYAEVFLAELHWRERRPPQPDAEYSTSPVRCWRSETRW